MKVTINGEVKEVSNGLSYKDLLTELGLSGPVAIERNKQVLPRAQHPLTAVEDGDHIEIVHFVGGG